VSFKIIRDAVHGDLTFSAAELRLIDTEAVQRLRGIKQLGTSSLVYPSATHTRFEHSLGTCAVAKRILDALAVNDGEPLDEESARVLLTAALVHDVTHVPFGHTFEDERRVLERHDESASRLAHFLRDSDLGEELERQGLADAVWQVLSPPTDVARPPTDAVRPRTDAVRPRTDAVRPQSQSPAPTFARQVVSGTICADLLDYLRRDARSCGLSQNYDDRLFRYFVREGDRLVVNLRRRGIFRPDALSELVNLLRLRYNLTERVYYHHAKVAAGAMVSKALELCLRAGAATPGDLLDAKDDSFLELLTRRGAEVPGVPPLLTDLRRRRLLKRVYYQTLEQPGQRGMSGEEQTEFERFYHLNENGARERVEAQLEGELGLPEGTAVLYCPAAKMALKEADAFVSLDSGAPQMLSSLHHPEVEVLLGKHRALWRFYVFLRQGHEDLYGRAGQLCEELLGQPNLLTLHSRGEMAFGTG
jgi:HD superfamily phosphohydrolase